MIGGKVIGISWRPWQFSAVRLTVLERQETENVLFVNPKLDEESVANITLGDSVWTQGGKVYWAYLGMGPEFRQEATLQQVYDWDGKEIV